MAIDLMARGIAASKADLVDGKIPSSQLPSYVDDVVEYANLDAFPATGESGKIYVATDTNKTYRWSGSTYIEVGGGGGSGTSNFNELSNRPKYNGTTMTGSTDIPEAKIFVAIFDTTTAAEVAAALTAGKAVVCEYKKDDIHCQMLLETESDSKYTFVETGVSTYNGTTSVYGYGAALNKSTNVWELVSGNGTIPSTAEQITYDSSAESHTSGSVGAQLAEQSTLISNKQNKAYVQASEPSAAVDGDVWVDTDENAVTSVIDTTPTSGSTNAISSGAVFTVNSNLSSQIDTLGDDIADEYDSTATYTSGDYAMHDGVLKKYNGSTWYAVKVTDEMGSGGSASWSTIFPQIESDTTPFDTTDPIIYKSTQIEYGSSSVKAKLDSLSTASGISYENTTVKLALDGKCDSDKVLEKMISDSETSDSSVVVPDYVSTEPASASATGLKGQMYIGTDYIYICTATDTWKRFAITTF